MPKRCCRLKMGTRISKMACLKHSQGARGVRACFAEERGASEPPQLFLAATKACFHTLIVASTKGRSCALR
jgi:hypothetical protein